MRVSQKLGYALHAVLELTHRADGAGFVRTGDIAQRQRIPEKFLEAIVVELRRAGLIVSQRGPVGGHRLARDPAQISVGDVWRAIEGAAFDAAGAGRPADVFGDVWRDAHFAVANVLDAMTFAELRRRAESPAAAPDFSI